MKRKKILCLLVISMLCLTGCADKKEEKKRLIFQQFNPSVNWQL